MAANVYEAMFILDSNRFARDAQGVAAQVDRAIEKAGAEILVSRLWNEQKLAYPIRGHKKGTYWLTYFRSEGDAIAGLKRELGLNDNILRLLILKVEQRIADLVVNSARAPSVAEAVPATGDPRGQAGEKVEEDGDGGVVEEEKAE